MAASAPTTAVAVDDTTPASNPGPDLGADIISAASAALERLGDLETAGVAIIVAHQAGYSFDQIVAGITSGALTEEGIIDEVEPGQAWGHFIAVTVAHRADTDLQAVGERLREQQAREDVSAEIFLGWLLQGIALGMDAQELIEALVLGDLIPEVQREWCYDRYESETSVTPQFRECMASAGFDPSGRPLGSSSSTTETPPAESPPAEGRFATAPGQADAGVPTAFTIEARGGVALDGTGSYAATVDFGDGTVVDLPIPAGSGTEWASA